MKNALIALGICGLAWSAALAADEDGSFAIEGAGLATCEKFTDAISAKSSDFYVFAGWLDGYMTAVNRFSAETYDLTPWQSTELLVRALRKHCESNKSEKFIAAVGRMIQSLYPDRLKSQSRVMSLEYGERGIIIYEATMRRVQGALAAQGYDIGGQDGIFGEQTRQAIEKFQKANRLAVTGVPDQATLSLLLGR